MYVPNESTLAYRAATKWVTYANYIYPAGNKDGDAVILFDVDDSSEVLPLAGTVGELVGAGDVPADPTKDTFVFAGWYKDAGLTTAWDWETDVFPKFNLTLHAKWEAV